MVRKRFLACLLAGGLGVAPPPAAFARAEEGFFTILLIGQDDASKNSVGAGEYPYGRADAILVASMNLLTAETRLLSVDRDMMIELPEHGVTKLCIANYFGGPLTVLEKVNALYGIAIDRYAMVGIDSMTKIVDRLGGIDIDVLEEDMEPVGLRKTGVQTLNKKQVIAYLRSREMVETGDAARNERQQRVMTAIIQKVIEGGTGGLMRFAVSVYPLLDTDLTRGELASLAGVALLRELRMPEQTRSPLLEERDPVFINTNYVVMPKDAEAEALRIRTFLYGE